MTRISYIFNSNVGMDLIEVFLDHIDVLRIILERGEKILTRIGNNNNNLYLY